MPNMPEFSNLHAVGQNTKQISSDAQFTKISYMELTKVLGLRCETDTSPGNCLADRNIFRTFLRLNVIITGNNN